MNANRIALVVSMMLLMATIGCASRAPVGEGEAAHSPEAHGDDHGHEETGAHLANEEPGSHSEMVELTPESIAAGGIQTSEAGPGAIRITAEMPGEIMPDADRLAHIVPRFAGIAKTIHKSLGDRVQKDEVLAIIESNESLAPYEVRSLISGTLIERHITLGEFVRDDADIFVVADLSSVWLMITVYPKDLERVRVGQRVVVRSSTGTTTAEGRVDYIGPVVSEDSRAATARVVLANPKRIWRPGMFVSADLVVSELRGAVTVVEGAVQRFEGNDVVFVEEEKGHFEPRQVQLGVDDGRIIEVLSGLAAGERYVSKGAFLIKSELLKSEAGHEH